MVFLALMKKEILVLGVMHSAQSDVLLKNHMKDLKKEKFSKDFIEDDRKKILSLRNRMFSEIDLFKPGLVIEECGPWEKEPGDKLIETLNGKKTILQEKYKNIHIFADAKLENGKNHHIKKERKR